MEKPKSNELPKVSLDSLFLLTQDEKSTIFKLASLNAIELTSDIVNPQPAINELAETGQHIFDADKLHPIDPTLLRDAKLAEEIQRES